MYSNTIYTSSKMQQFIFCSAFLPYAISCTLFHMLYCTLHWILIILLKFFLKALFDSLHRREIRIYVIE